jgi:hypothetical protein
MTVDDFGSRARFRMLCRAVFAALALCAGVHLAPSLAQGGFQIVWVMIGEAATDDESGDARAGRRLFDAGDIASRALENVRIVRIDARPIVTEIEVGQRWCVSSLELRAFGPGGEFVPEAPVSITVRQDLRDDMRLTRSRRDICLRPTIPGEYPLRFTSLLPAPDGTMRGAQVFVRASDPASAGDAHSTLGPMSDKRPNMAR